MSTVQIVATTTILGDIARNVVGDKADVEVLMPVGVNPHDFQPSSQQVAAIQRADLVVANGLGLEAGLHDVLEAAESDGVLVWEVAPDLDPRPFAATADDDEQSETATTTKRPRETGASIRTSGSIHSGSLRPPG